MKPLPRFIKFLIVFSYLILLVIAWQVLIPLGAGYALWRLWKSEKKSSLRKKVYTGLIMVGSTCLWMTIYFNSRPAQLFIDSPAEVSTSTQRIVAIKGRVKPSSSVVKINGVTISTVFGSFEQTVEASEEHSIVTVTAQNMDGPIAEQSLTINRIFSAEESAAMAKAKKEAEELAVQQAVEEKAEQAAWEKTPAGKICKKHPEWEREECRRVANKNIWIGMRYDMLVYMMGEPDSSNLSNYGRGDRYQYCWDGRKPRCYYDDNDDGLIDSYN